MAGALILHLAYMNTNSTLRVILIGTVLAAVATLAAAPATGPLRVSQENPRYFADASGKVVYLTGSHTWSNLQDMGKTDPPPAFDYHAYLALLREHHHNFIRLWIVEHAWDPDDGTRVAPLPWLRTGSGNALDGKPRFDLTQLDPAFFQRIRQRVLAARAQGIYVSVMLFDDWSTENPGPWKGHPFHASNNVNGVDADPNHDGLGLEFHTLQSSNITRLQEVYVRKIVETVNDLDNVLYEIANETGVSKEWQYHFIRYIKALEQVRPQQHPVGMTVAWPVLEVDNAALFASPAEWISPNSQGGYKDDPPAADGRKVVLTDTDHLWGEGGDSPWVWKSFCRGLNPIYMDRLAVLTANSLGDLPGAERVRKAMGHTRLLAERMNLVAVTPRADLATSGYCLANAGKEYLVYLPNGGTVTVDLTVAEGKLAVEWRHPIEGTRTLAGTVDGGGKRAFTAPFRGDAVLYLSGGSGRLDGFKVTVPLAKLGAIPAAADFFVSPQGKDTWSGKHPDPGEQDGPFATAARARDAVHAVLKARTHPKAIRVVLRAGTYYLDSPLEFGPQDSGTVQAPVVYTAAAGERVVLSGGRRLDHGRWGEVNGRRAWVVDIAEAKPGTWRFRQLFVNGERRPRTRLPKQGEYRIESLPGYTGDFLRSPTKQFVYAPGDIMPAWHNLRDVEVVGITRWLDNRLPIESVSAQTRTVTFDRPSLFALLTGDGPGSYWVENVFEALDTPGQWYLDRPGGVLYYLPLPGEEMPPAEIIAPRLPQVVRVVGREDAPVHDLRFEGLIVAHTEWQPPADHASSLQAGIEVPGALQFEYAERCAVTGGGIEHIGNYGVEVGVGCADIEIARNQITDTGAGGVRIGHFFSWETDGSGRLTERGIQRKVAMPKGPRSQRITVADNEIAHCGRFTPEAVGVFVGDNPNNQVIHNHIHDLFYYAEGKAIGDYGGGRCGLDVCVFDRNLYWNVSGSRVFIGNQSFSQWQATGQDKHSVVADPLFVDPMNGNFALRPGSPARQIGFEPWDISSAGPRRSSATPKNISEQGR